jgi:hypothetical protein
MCMELRTFCFKLIVTFDAEQVVTVGMLLNGIREVLASNLVGVGLLTTRSAARLGSVKW